MNPDDYDPPNDADLDDQDQGNERLEDLDVANRDSLFWQGAQFAAGFDLREYRKGLGIDDGEEY